MKKMFFVGSRREERRESRCWVPQRTGKQYLFEQQANTATNAWRKGSGQKKGRKACVFVYSFLFLFSFSFSSSVNFSPSSFWWGCWLAGWLGNPIPFPIPFGFALCYPLLLRMRGVCFAFSSPPYRGNMGKGIGCEVETWACLLLFLSPGMGTGDGDGDGDGDGGENKTLQVRKYKRQRNPIPCPRCRQASHPSNLCPPPPLLPSLPSPSSSAVRKRAGGRTKLHEQGRGGAEAAPFFALCWRGPRELPRTSKTVFWKEGWGRGEGGQGRGRRKGNVCCGVT